VADFATAEHFGGVTNLRFDDTNPAKEETEFVEGIEADIRWLGFDWKGGLYFASEYYPNATRSPRTGSNAAWLRGRTEP
jgi:glutaminyl-tRNA synthetase